MIISCLLHLRHCSKALGTLKQELLLSWELNLVSWNPQVVLCWFDFFF